jgi:hypothetical protein
MKLTILLFSILISFSTYSFGKLNYGIYNAQSSSSNSDIIEAYMSGLNTGIVWANASIEYHHKTRLFCPPKRLAITTENAQQILEAEAKKQLTKRSKEDVNGISVALLLIGGLMDTFPCK